MSTAVASPTSLGPWSASQRKAASRIFAQALFSALPNASRNKVAEHSWKSVREVLAPENVLPQVIKEHSCDTDEDDDSQYNEDESCSGYSESYDDESSYTEVRK